MSAVKKGSVVFLKLEDFFASLARGPSFEQEGSEAGFCSSCLEQ